MDEVERRIKALGDTDVPDRSKIAKRLGELSDVRAIPALIEALKDGDPHVRAGAGLNLVKIGVPAVPALIAALKDGDPDVRWGSAEALGEMAKANPRNAEVLKVIPALVGALKDEDSDVRERAAWALWKILKGCDKTESLDMFEKGIKEGAEALRKADRTKDDVHDAMVKVAKLMDEAAEKKNKLAWNAMQKDGLMLSGEKPKPPTGRNGMYQAVARQAVRG